MNVKKINFTGNYSKGKEEFKKLPREKQLGKIAIEEFRQERGYLYGIKRDKSDLGALV